MVGKDSLHLSYTLYPTDSVKGKMTYDNFEKRWFYWKSVYGIKSGDTLKLTYDMFSEGMWFFNRCSFWPKTINFYEGNYCFETKERFYYDYCEW